MKRIDGSYRQLDHETNSVKGVGAMSWDKVDETLDRHKSNYKKEQKSLNATLLFIKSFFMKFKE